MKLAKKDKAQIRKWVEALYSGKYKQGIGSLQSFEGYCCLGVGCRVLIPKNKLRLDKGVIVGEFPGAQPNAPRWLQKINEQEYGIGDKSYLDKYTLSYINDEKLMTFEEIGMLIQFAYLCDSGLYESV